MAVCVRLFCGLFIGVVSLSACGGGGGSSAAPPTAASHGQQGAAALAVFVPSASSSSARRREQLPSSTQSVEIVVANESAGTQLTPTIVNISPTTSGCSSVSGGIDCTINVNVPFGTLLFGVVGYTGQNATGNPVAWGDTVATISAGGSNAVAITTSSVVSYFTMSLDGNISLATIDHSANTLSVEDLSNNSTISGALSYLSNGDEKFVVGSSTDSGTPVGSVVYLRELVGTALTFFSTNSSSPPVTGLVQSGADWGVGTALTACPTTTASYDVSIVTVEGPQYQVGSNLTTGTAFQNGTAAIAINSGSSDLSFNGTSYTINGTTGSAETGMAGPCSGGIFSATSTSGQLALDPQGVIVGANSNTGSSTSEQNGEIGFTVQSGSTLNIAAITGATYDGFLGNFQVSGSTVDKSGEPINVVPGGSNTLVGCQYTNFEAGTVGTANCATIAFGSQPFPGIVFATLTESAQTIPAVFAVSQVNGKYVIFGVVGSGNIALFQH